MTKTLCKRFPRLEKCLARDCSSSRLAEDVLAFPSPAPASASASASASSRAVKCLEELGWKLDLDRNELEDLIMHFGEAEQLEDGGWILPGGEILDFQRGHHSGRSAKPHSLIYGALSPERQAVLKKIQPLTKLLDPDASIAIDALLASGFIRFQLTLDPSCFAAYFSLERNPTSGQVRALQSIAKLVREESETSLASSRFIGVFECCGSHCSYSDAEEFSRRFASDVVQAAS